MGVFDSKAIQFENEDGEIETVDFDTLDKETQLTMLRELADPGLSEHEIQVVNYLRQNNASFDDVVNYFAEQKLQEYLTENPDQVRQKVYSIDEYTNDELYLADLKNKYPDFTDEELLAELDAAKLNLSDPIWNQSTLKTSTVEGAATPVYATGNGRVKKAGWQSGYGKLIIIDHGFGYETWYAHLNDYDVRPGQRVVRGEVIGEVGNTGKSTGPHLHYEVHVKGKVVNPVNYYFMDLSAEDYDKMIELAANQGKVFD